MTGIPEVLHVFPNATQTAKRDSWTALPYLAIYYFEVLADEINLIIQDNVSFNKLIIFIPKGLNVNSPVRSAGVITQ